VCVTTFHYRHEAELARGALRGQRIEATIMADDMGSENPQPRPAPGRGRISSGKQTGKRAQVLDLAE